MAVNIRRDAWKDDRQYDDIRQIALEIERLQPSVGILVPVWTGFSAAPSASLPLSWMRQGRLVVIYNNTGANITGTSNTTGMQITNLPNALTPRAARNGYCVVVNSGGELAAELQIGIGGAMTFGPLNTATIANRATADVLGFTAAGVKGIPSGFLVAYML